MNYKVGVFVHYSNGTKANIYVNVQVTDCVQAHELGAAKAMGMAGVVEATAFTTKRLF